MRLIVITGISGAGKSLAAKYLEDSGFFCIDNLPPMLIPKIAEMFNQGYGRIDKIAFVVDIRGGELLNDLLPGLEELRKEGRPYEILFMEASDSSVINRYKETRRSHPLAPEGQIVKGLSMERELLQKIKDRADYIVDTTDLLPAQLRDALGKIVSSDLPVKSLQINILSFGFKYGLPPDCDLVFDVRFLPNPFYVENLKKLSGLDQPVSEFVLRFPETKEFLAKLEDMLTFLLPNYLREGKTQLVIGIGCTGGRHRSVAIAVELYRWLQDGLHRVAVMHRDIER